MFSIIGGENVDNFCIFCKLCKNTQETENKKALSKMYEPKLYEIIYIKQTFKGTLQQDGSG